MMAKTIYIPPMAYGSARAFASAFRAIGLEAEPTPPSDHRTRELGARHTSGDECYPAKVTVGDFMKVLERPDADRSRIALFMPTAEGPCRFGQYAPYLRQILNANGYEDVEILSPTSENSYEGLGGLAGTFVRTGWRALLCADLLHKLLLMHRPYETRRGDTDAVYEESLADLCRTLERTPVEPGVQLQSLRDSMVRSRARFHGAVARPVPHSDRANRAGTPADRNRGRNLLPVEHLLQRKPGGVPGTIRRRSVAQRSGGVDLVHQQRAFPEAEIGGTHLDHGSARRVGAAACPEA
jgi:hypothetical protein